MAADGDFEAAIARAGQAGEIYAEIGNNFGTGWAAYMIASLLITQNQLDDVDRYLKESLDIFTTSRDESGILLVLTLYAIVADRRGYRDRFLMLGGAAERLRDDTSAGLAASPLEFLDYGIPEMPTDVDEQRKWAEGRKLSTDEAVALARETPE